MEKITEPAVRWYFKTPLLVFIFLCVGPLVLPLIWLHPQLSLRKKTIITIVVVILTYFLVILTAQSLKTIKEYYQLAF